MYLSYNEACGKECSDLMTDLKLCEKNGMDYIEIRLDMLKNFLKSGSLEEIKKFFEDSYLKPHAINAIYLTQDILEGDTLNENSQAMKDFIFTCEVGKAIGSHYMILVPPFDPSGVFKGDILEAEKNCVDILKQLSELARPYKMKLCFELVGLKKSCVRTIEAADRIIRAVNQDNVGFVFDSYNIYLCGKCNDFSKIAQVQKDKIFAIHLMSADCVPEEEMGQDKRCFPGEGVVDTNAFLKILKEVGYEGMVSVETFRPQYWEKTPEWVIQNAYESLYKILEKNDCL
jgi:2-keto-myo-inositol isomerase